MPTIVTAYGTVTVDEPSPPATVPEEMPVPKVTVDVPEDRTTMTIGLEPVTAPAVAANDRGDMARRVRSLEDQRQGYQDDLNVRNDVIRSLTRLVHERDETIRAMGVAIEVLRVKAAIEDLKVKSAAPTEARET